VEGNGQNPQNKRKNCLVLLDFELTGMQKKKIIVKRCPLKLNRVIYGYKPQTELMKPAMISLLLNQCDVNNSFTLHAVYI